MDIKDFFRDWAEATIELSDSEKGRLATAIIADSIGEKSSILTGNERYIYPLYSARLKNENADRERAVNRG